MKIGVIKETRTGESRVATTPAIAKKLIGKGFTVQVETGAGEAAHFHNDEYLEAGVELVDRQTALSADLILSVRRPLMDDVEMMAEKNVYVSHLENCEDDGTLAKLLTKDITPIAMEHIPRISRAQSMDALSSQSNIAGYRAVVEAAARFRRFLPLMMTSAGSAKPARLVVLGVGVAGLQAIATARRLGADVYAYDVRPETREQVESLGAKWIEIDVGESGEGTGGYAKELSDEAKQRQQELLSDELAKAHVIVTTALIPCRPAPVLIPNEVVKRMREGSVIVDLAAGNGGNCQLTEADKVVEKHGVILVGHTNYPSMMSTDASNFYAQNLFNLVQIMVEEKEGQLVFNDFEEDEITQAAQVRQA
ncbi:Re/Si-specific NAD(P)(+) transhydrogenase subunit alpha [Solemya elarraichensis gill symbiont]|uniref:NAD(P) transhydrogenase subunit alpha part 1 n=1 Tax=Solemya elarraichensis gill symbiont TaxID=1918949 RepID=A0A1T2LC99_9GAMM|nr:Re/Si-specific NAD(P)(+) transhydrogenase subunit alpha [Solemya elarraichensis gill symbiont]OOZ42642.1 NADP transhydrogenase subunit alpha [Solemya elarraichensis gill symbiont]